MNLRKGVPVLLAALLLGGCGITMQMVRGSGVVATQDQALSNVSGVTLATPGELTVQLGETESLHIEMEDNLLPYLQTTQQDGKLTIQFKRGANLQPTKPIKYILTVKGLDSLETASVGNITAPALQAKSFIAKIASTGKIDLAGLTADKLNVELSSVGALTIGPGQVTSQVIEINSSGSYSAPDLQSQKAAVNVNSAGNVTIWVTDKLDAKISSSGVVEYYGSPQVTTTFASSGKVVPLGNK
jgi:hypothetical protein